MEKFIKEVEVNGVNHNITLGDNMIGSGLKKDDNGVVSLDINEEKLVKTTWAELKSLRDNSQLTPGSFYRITDYVTTTTQSETKSANHPFDVIVLALSENTISEDAKAILHEGDTYFADSDLSAWELKYCLDNDKTSFEWADETNGKGVIYRMVDEKRNDCPYDFKNILFYNTILTNYITLDNYYYTFSYVIDNILYDGTTDKQVKFCYGNKMKGYKNELGVFNLNNNVFRNTSFGNRCHSNTFEYDCRSNTFEKDCHDNTFGYCCWSNTFESSCHFNTFGYRCYSNTFGYYCHANTFGYECTNNTFGEDCNSNIFKDYCRDNTFGNYCFSNTFGYSCSNNTFGDSCDYNTLESDCDYNTFEDSCCYRKLEGNSEQTIITFSEEGDSEQTVITYSEEFYDNGSGQIVPIKHPDLSTQPSILPYKFMEQYVYEQLIPVNKGDRVVKNTFAIETPMIMSAGMFSINSFKNINIPATISNALLLDTLSEVDGYINIRYTDSSVLPPLDEPSNNSSIDFGILSDDTPYIYDNNINTLTLSKNGELVDTYMYVPSKYANSSKIIIDNNVTSIGYGVFYNWESITSVKIPNSVTSIGDKAFRNCYKLTSIEIPNSVNSFGHLVFWGCSGLTSMVIGNNVTSIGESIFCGCSGLTSIVVEDGNSVYDSREGSNAIIESSTNTLIAGCNNTIIPSSVTSIGNNAFSECSGLTSVVIPNNVTNIGNNAFSECSGLTSVVIPNNVTNIGEYAFSDCTSLTSITCKAINPPSIYTSSFNNVSRSTSIYVPAESVEAYKSADYWKRFTNIQAINE